MSWFASIVVGLLTGALALVCAGLVANACVSWYRISSFEGGAGYFVVGMALLGGIAGTVLGVVVSRLVAAGSAPGFLRSLGVSCATVAAIAGLVAAVSWLLADIPPEIGGRQLELEVEVRLPVGETAVPAEISGDAYLSLAASSHRTVRASRRGELAVHDARREGGRWIVPGAVFVFTTRGERVLDLVLGGETRAGFLVPLPRRPGKGSERWSDWLPRPPAGSPPWPDSKYSYRFRVRRIEPPPPEPSPEEIAAREFAALSAATPLAAWLRFVRYDQPEERIAAAMAAIGERQDELAQAVRAGGPVREDALLAVVRLTRVAPEVAEVVLAEGRELAAAIRTFNAMSAEDPGFYDVQVELRSRFNYWHRAWWTVHQRTGADGRPPVQEVLDLALVRAADTSMDEIVVNARAHLGGLEPAESEAR